MAAYHDTRPRLSLRVNLLAALALLGVFVARADEAPTAFELTEAELSKYDGSDASLPIYVAVDGKIFDVSASPAFYGPGGHYNHFAGKDASRAWVTECWDTPDQLTWRMDGLEAMFMPKYMDEQMQNTASGDSAIPGVGDTFGGDQLKMMAQKVIEKTGKVTEKELKARRKEDKKEAKEKMDAALQHWFDFFHKNEKYSLVGTVIHDESRPEPPEICQEAMDKRPLKGGKLEKMMAAGNVMGGQGAKQKKPPPETPDFIKKMIKEKVGAENMEPDNDPAEASPEEEEEDLVRDEL